MRRFTFALLVAACVLGAVPALVAAQLPTYEENALRLEESHGSVRLVRGRQGVIVGTVNGFRTFDLANVVKASPDAVVEAKKFERNYRPASIVLGLGLAVMGAGIGTSHIDGINSSIPISLTVLGFGLSTYGGNRLQAAYTALSRSLWWYNRGLTR